MIASNVSGSHAGEVPVGSRAPGATTTYTSPVGITTTGANSAIGTAAGTGAAYGVASSTYGATSNQVYTTPTTTTYLSGGQTGPVVGGAYGTTGGYSSTTGYTSGVQNVGYTTGQTTGYTTTTGGYAGGASTAHLSGQSHIAGHTVNIGR